MPAHCQKHRLHTVGVVVTSPLPGSHNVYNLLAALAGLDERSRAILQARWLDEEKATLHQLAKRFGVSAERIRQLEKNAMRKLQQVLAA